MTTVGTHAIGYNTKFKYKTVDLVYIYFISDIYNICATELVTIRFKPIMKTKNKWLSKINFINNNNQFKAILQIIIRTLLLVFEDLAKSFTLFK